MFDKSTVRGICIAVAALGAIAWVLQVLISDDPARWYTGTFMLPIVALAAYPLLTRLAPMSTRFGFRRGTLALGTLVSAKRTPVRVNSQPVMNLVLEVETADGQLFRGTATQIFSRREIRSLVPGTTFPVLYHPDKTDGNVRLVLKANRADMDDLMMRIELRKSKTGPGPDPVPQQGIDAQAVVQEMTSTGEIRDGREVIGAIGPSDQT